MSASIEEIRSWLNDIDERCVIAVAEDGLTLVGVTDHGEVITQYELGGLTMCKCQDCDWRGPITEVITPIPDLEQRVGCGEEMPAGECPECGALAHEEGGVRV